MSRRPEFIIYTYPWDEQVGGIIALHALCARLNQLGYRAALWPAWKPATLPRDWHSLRTWIAYFIKGRFLRLALPSPFRLRTARRRDRQSAIVVYPEVVAGNPLAVRKVVRWLLYKPGAHTGIVDFGVDDLVVFYNEAFTNSFRKLPADHLLRVTYKPPAYRQWNFNARSGACVILRKGRNRSLDKHPQDAIIVDTMTHKQRAVVFNQVEFCYSYDLYSYLAVCAAVCGCTVIIVPEKGLAEVEWQPERTNRLGLAYGTKRIHWAEATRPELLKKLELAREFEDITVRNFAALARRWFTQATEAR